MSAPSPIDGHTPIIEEEASKSLQQVWFVLKEQKWILGGGLAIGLLIGIVLFYGWPNVYESRSQFIIDDLPFKLDAANNGGDGTVSQFLVQSLIKSIPSTEMQEYVAEHLNVPKKNINFEDLSPKLNLRALHEANIRVENPRESRIGLVIADASSPEFAADVVNAVTDKFQQLNFIAGHIADLDLKITGSRDRLTKLGDQLVAASGERIRFERQKLALEAYLQRGQQIENYPVFASDTTLNNLKTRHFQVKSEYESLASYSVRGKKLEGSQAELQNLDDQIRKYSEDLGESLRVSYEISLNQEKALQQAVNDEQTQISHWSREMSRDIEAIGDLKLRKALDLSNSDAQEVKQASVIVVMERGQPVQRRKAPRGSVCIGIGLTLGLALGISGAFILYTLDRRVKLPPQIEALTQVRCLAVITSSPKTDESGAHISRVPRGLYFLRSQLLRAAITGTNDRIFSFTGLNDEADVVKTVAQLAVLLAETEKKTLVVDLFFNSGAMCKSLGVEAKGGLNQWFFSDEEISHFINYTAVRELAVLDSKVSMDYPEDLISRRPLIPSLEAMKSSWDFILIAAPPLLELSHLLFAAPLGSPVIAIAEYLKSSLDDLRQLQDRCGDEGLRLTGVVLNNYPLENILGKQLVFGMGGHRYLFESPDSKDEKA